jgi:hypothetical protein
MVVIAAACSWLTWDFWRLHAVPLRDFHLYLGAGATALGGTSPYLTTPLATYPPVDQLPFVYPPFTIPLFELLASIPRPVANSLWVVASTAAVMAGLWLLGVRGRWLLVLLAWPPAAEGIVSGNVATFAFFLFVLGFRYGAALVLSGAFKVQSLIPSVWLLRERRWRDIAIGVGVVAIIALISVPIVGPHVWWDWPAALRAFQESNREFPGLMGHSLQRRLGDAAFVIAALAVGFGLLRRGRNGLARLGAASVVASPTLYLHGLLPALAGALVLGPELLWFVLAVGPWPIGFGIQTPWLTLVLVGLALVVSRGNDLLLPGDLSPARRDVHPVGASRQVWPDPREGAGR